MRFALIGIVVLLLLIGALIYSQSTDRQIAQNPQTGIGGGPPDNNNNDTNLNLRERATIHTALQEHAVAASLYLQQLYNGEDTTNSLKRVQDNTVKVNEFFKNNPNFANVWTSHIENYEAYTLALKNGNRAGAETIKQELLTHADEFGRVVNSIYPSVDANAATEAMREHGTLTLSIVDAHANDDTSLKATQMAKASAQAAKFAEILVPDNNTE